MTSLRVNLSLLVGAAAAVLAVVTVAIIGAVDWQEHQKAAPSRLLLVADTIERQLSQQSEQQLPLNITPPGDDVVVAVFDAQQNIMLAGGPGATPDRMMQLLEAFVGPAQSTPTHDAGPTSSPFDPNISFNASMTFEETTPVFLDGQQWVGNVWGCMEEKVCSLVVVAERPLSVTGYFVQHAPGYVATIALITLLAMLTTRWLVGRALRAVINMSDEVDEITAADLSQRIAVPSTGDELETLGHSFNRSIERLAAGVEAQRRFASDAAHELRSPLAGLRATLEVAQRKPERTDEAIAASIGQVDRATALLSDMLTLARNDGAQEPLQTRVTDIDDLVRSEARGFAMRFPETSLDTSKVMPVQAQVAPEMLAQVIRNLLDNAARYANGNLAVSLRSQGAPNADDELSKVAGWRLVVDDDGPGVKPEDRARIFERFTRLDESRSRDTGGTGLGLAITKEIVTRHHGTICVDDSPLGGARFIVEVTR